MNKNRIRNQDFEALSGIACLADIPAPKPLIAEDTHGMTLLPSGYGYRIEWIDCRTCGAILKWALHLTGKTWGSPEMIREFITKACKRHNINPWQ